jgi:YbgC/YbaW family acyl-CoA thioester hydrolase
MISSHTESFKVRSYECDLYGHVNNAVYLRYLQEANLAFSCAAGWPPERYTSSGFKWWPFRIDFEYLVPLRYGDTVSVTTRATRIDKTAFQQSYEFHNMKTGQMVATANTLSTLRDPYDGSINQLPDEIKSAFTPHEPKITPAPFLTPIISPPPPPGKFQMHKRVDLHQVNSEKVLDPATLLVYASECGRQVINAHGWPMERMLEEGFAILLKSNQVEYFQPAKLDDELELATWVSNLRRVSALRHYTIQRVKDGERLACIHALGVWVNMANGAPRRAPQQFLADFAPNISVDSTP